MDEILALLTFVPNLRSRAMFGGHGLWSGTRFFGIVYRDRLYLRTTPATVPHFTQHGMGPFRPNARQTLRDYYEVAPVVLASPDELRLRTLEAIEAAVARMEGT